MITMISWFSTGGDTGVDEWPLVLARGSISLTWCAAGGNVPSITITEAKINHPSTVMGSEPIMVGWSLVKNSPQQPINYGETLGSGSEYGSG